MSEDHLPEADDLELDLEGEDTEVGDFEIADEPPAPQPSADQLRAFQQQQAAALAARQAQIARQQFEQLRYQPDDEVAVYFHAQAQRALADHLDQQAFQNWARQQGIPRRRMQEVEQVLATARQSGHPNATRALVYRGILGEEAHQAGRRLQAPGPPARAPVQRRRTAEDDRLDALLKGTTIRDLERRGRW